MKKLSLFLTLMVFILGCVPRDEITPTPSSLNRASDYSADFLRDWFKLECRVVKETPGFLPPQAARAFGYTGVTVYEAVYRGIPQAKSLAGQLNGLSPAAMPQADALSIRYHWGLVANTAVAEIMRLMFGKNLSEKNRTLINEKEELVLKALSGYSKEFVLNDKIATTNSHIGYAFNENKIVTVNSAEDLLFDELTVKKVIMNHHKIAFIPLTNYNKNLKKK